MSEYFETEEVVKGYDHVIMGRILSYLKPYGGLVLLTVIALGISTAGELLVPIIEQRIIDGALMVRFLPVYAGGAGRTGLDREAAEALDGLLKGGGVSRIGDVFFVPQNQDTRITGRVERELREKGLLGDERWYVFRYEPGDPVLALMDREGDLFLREGHRAAIRTRDLYSLPLEDIRAVRARDVSLILVMAAVLFILLFMVFVFTFIQTWTTTLIGQRVMKDMRLALFKKTTSQSTDFLSRHPVGRIVTRLTGDVETINEFFVSVLVAFLKDLSVMAGVLITLFLLSPKLAVVVLLILPPVMAVTAVSRLRARDAFRRQRIASSRINSYLSERLSGIQVVQLFLREKRSSREFGERNSELLDANLGEMYVFATFRPIVEFFATFTTAAVIVVGAAMLLNLSLSLGVLIAFINLVGMFYSPIMDIAEKYTILQSAMAGGERVFKTLDTEERIDDRGGVSVEGRIRGLIEFEDVHFSYKKGEEVLRGLSFTVQPGEMTSIVG
ncbi:MAG: ABC transporter ATP-binding protein [Spirochaetaceae bacterium]|nr:ABC transporter ATP-binding protein [Spirochaetaceae bacterium]